MNEFLTIIVFYIALLSIVAILILSLSAFVSKTFSFFPPPGKDSWQYKVFWVLFRLMFVGLLYLSYSEFSPEPVFSNQLRHFLWLPLLVLGFGAATVISAKLGWENAHGEKGGLVVSGLYRWSRNPIYVTSLVGMIGWGFFVNSHYVTTLLVLWALMYLLAPFIEEKWLEKSYGDEFLKYKSRTSRFFGFPRSFTEGG